jgi:hypothetical protein
VNAVKPAQAWAAGGGYPCRFEHRGCKAILKTKESEQSHASKSCRFRPDGAAAIATARVGAIKRPAKVAGKVVGQRGRAAAPPRPRPAPPAARLRSISGPGWSDESNDRRKQRMEVQKKYFGGGGGSFWAAAAAD